ncbi:hypothetical protein SAMN05421747_10784 [Parapedobacter composti]|uniref:Uncharacterized protein n=1 Tax=Parapedobacter composti TaxID=623281 RepID=A0A1I1HXL7_9SPHI|nr:hypothetical protein SAMN05421747_10784 [Parapedobacter composti]
MVLAWMDVSGLRCARWTGDKATQLAVAGKIITLKKQIRKAIGFLDSLAILAVY